eukprot:GFUD01039448.1.p1 GENE.GFUD01039448.1~~GFUD01039448.1.p1  ORF type:complete len:172 (+),score=55.21 GFUD01039448.1:54-518(+)
MVDFNSLFESKIETDEASLKEMETTEKEVATGEPSPEPAAEPEPEPAAEPGKAATQEGSSAVKISIDDYSPDYSDLNNEFLVNEVLIPGDNEEGSGYFPSSSDKLDSEVIKDTPANVDIQVLNYGVNGVTEVPGRSHSATPGVDFGLIQEIRNI